MPQYKIRYHKTEEYVLTVQAGNPAAAKKKAQRPPFDDWINLSDKEGRYEMDLLGIDEKTGKLISTGYINWYDCDD